MDIMDITLDFSDLEKVLERLMTEDGTETKPEDQKTTYVSLDIAGAGYQRQSKVRVAVLNVRSLEPKLPKVTELIKENDLDLFLLTETWLKDKNNEKAFKEKFQIYHVPRKEKQGGGVAVLVSNHLESEHVTEHFPTVKTFEYMAVKIKSEKWEEPALVLNVYRPPGGTLKDFWGEFKQLLDQAFKKYKDVIVTGDLNNKWKTFLDLLGKKGCNQHVNEPTHKAGNILDLVISKTNQLKISDPTVRDDEISDHYTVYFSMNVGKKTKNVPKGDRKAQRK